jgi:hypothetical protein
LFCLSAFATFAAISAIVAAALAALAAFVVLFAAAIAIVREDGCVVGAKVGDTPGGCTLGCL